MPFRKRGRRALPRERKSHGGKEAAERYRRLDQAERAAIQNGLERGWSCRRMARELGRSPSTVADEVNLNLNLPRFL